MRTKRYHEIGCLKQLGMVSNNKNRTLTLDTSSKPSSIARNSRFFQYRYAMYVPIHVQLIQKIFWPFRNTFRIIILEMFCSVKRTEKQSRLSRLGFRVHVSFHGLLPRRMTCIVSHHSNEVRVIVIICKMRLQCYLHLSEFIMLHDKILSKVPTLFPPFINLVLLTG